MILAAIDFETANPEPDSACAVSVVLFNKNEILETITRLIRPPYKNFTFSHLHGIKYEDVANEPEFPHIWGELSKKLKNIDYFCAHNAVFDRNVLRKCCLRYRISPPDNGFLCTVKIATRHFNIKPARLDFVCRKLNIPLQHHNPESDARACATILLKAIQTGYPLPPLQLTLFEAH